MSECRKLKSKEAAKGAKTTASSQLQVQLQTPDTNVEHVMPVHPLFVPYCKSGNIVRPDGSQLAIQMLRDTGAMQSLLRAKSCDSSDYTLTNDFRILKGISKQTVTVPLVEVHLQCSFTDDVVLCGLVDELPEGIDFLIGNDIWLKYHPMSDSEIELAVVTRSMATKVNPNDQLLPAAPQTAQLDSPDSDTPLTLLRKTNRDVASITDRNEMIHLQKQDPSLTTSAESAILPPFPVGHPYFYVQDGMLMHHAVVRKRQLDTDQIVVPSCLRSHLLRIAHDIPTSAHLGIAKTRG